MNINATTDPYRSQSVNTAGPAQLVLMLYDGALAAIVRARHADVGAERFTATDAVNHELQRAQAIVTELQVTLDRERGGSIAANLHALYDFCIDRLVTANVSKDLSELGPVERTLNDLRDAWAASCCATPAIFVAG